MPGTAPLLSRQSDLPVRSGALCGTLDIAADQVSA